MYTKRFCRKIFHINKLAIIIIFPGLIYPSAMGSPKESNKTSAETINFTVTVSDRKTSDPLQLVSVIIKKRNTILAATSTNQFGRAIFNELQNGNYEISTRFIGYYDFKDTITIDKQHKSLAIQISEKDIQLKEIEVRETE